MNNGEHQSRMGRLKIYAAGDTDFASLVAFRVLFGLLMVLQTITYSSPLLFRFIRDNSAFEFKYIGFHWVKPLPDIGLYLVLAVLFLSSVGVLVGCFYRLSCAVFCLCTAYLFLLDASDYLNHVYLIILLAGLMAFVPAHTRLSVDAWRHPGLARGCVPRWSLWLLRGQLSLVYLFAGVAKLNRDWLSGEPMRHWLAYRGRSSSLFGEVVGAEPTAWVVSYGGLGFDLLVVPFLLWRRTRFVAFSVAASFHVSNWFLFNIGVFPWLMLAATTLFLSPSWPRRLARVDSLFGEVQQEASSPSREKALWLVGVYLLFQVAIPLRHHAYPGAVAWTEEGHYFSWRMKLRDKRGTVYFAVSAPGRHVVVDPLDELSNKQARTMVGRPELIRQYAHHLADHHRGQWHADVAVRVDSKVYLNFRERQRLVDPLIDVSRARASLLPYSWILPFE